MLTITCPGCRATTEVADSLLNHWTTCPACGLRWAVLPAPPQPSDGAGGRGEILLEGPKGEVVRLPVDNIEGVAEAGRGHRMRASGTAGIERLPDLLAVSSALSQAVPLPPSPLAGLDEAFRHSHNREQRIRELARTVLGVELDSDLAVMEFFAAEYGYTPADYEELSDRQILLMIQQRIRREQGVERRR